MLGGPSAARGCAAWRDVPKRTSNPLARLLSSAASAGEDSPPPELLEGSEADRVVLTPFLSSPSCFALSSWPCDVQGRLESAPFPELLGDHEDDSVVLTRVANSGTSSFGARALAFSSAHASLFLLFRAQRLHSTLENDAPRVIHDDRFLEVVDLPVEIIVRLRGSSRWRIHKKFWCRLCARGFVHADEALDVEELVYAV